MIIEVGGFPASGIICCEDCDDREAAENEAWHSCAYDFAVRCVSDMKIQLSHQRNKCWVIFIITHAIWDTRPNNTPNTTWTKCRVL